MGRNHGIAPLLHLCIILLLAAPLQLCRGAIMQGMAITSSQSITSSVTAVVGCSVSTNVALTLDLSAFPNGTVFSINATSFADGSSLVVKGLSASTGRLFATIAIQKCTFNDALLNIVGYFTLLATHVWLQHTFSDNILTTTQATIVLTSGISQATVIFGPLSQCSFGTSSLPFGG